MHGYSPILFQLVRFQMQILCVSALVALPFNNWLVRPLRVLI